MVDVAGGVLEEVDRDRNGWHRGAGDVQAIPRSEISICTNFKDHKNGQKKILQKGKEVCDECQKIATVKVKSMIRA